jgi:hypothetical protein
LLEKHDESGRAELFGLYGRRQAGKDFAGQGVAASSRLIAQDVVVEQVVRYPVMNTEQGPSFLSFGSKRRVGFDKPDMRCQRPESDSRIDPAFFVEDSMGATSIARQSAMMEKMPDRFGYACESALLCGTLNLIINKV